MKAIRVFLVDKTGTHKKLLERRLLNPDAIRFNITHANAKNAEDLFRDAGEQTDIILFGEKVAPASILQLTKVFRARNLTVPIFILTTESEVRLPRNFQKAGVDDLLNIADIETPLFSWSFMSTVEQTILRKKAKEYDILHRRLNSINESLAFLMHEINNPLSVIRLALYHLENPELPKNKREVFFKLLVDNLERVETRMNELRMIRRQLGGESATRTRILSIKPTNEASASR